MRKVGLGLGLAGLLMFGTVAEAQVLRAAVGGEALFTRQAATFSQNGLADIALQEDLGLAGNITFYEVNLCVATRGFSIRGYHLFNRALDGDGVLRPGQYPARKGEKEKKTILVNSSFSLSSSRLEAGIPFIGPTTVVEPFWVIGTIRESLQIQGPEINLNVENNPTSSGFGVFATQAISRSAAVDIKYLKTGIEQLLEMRYIVAGPQYYWKLGYAWRQLQAGSVRCNMGGPVVEVAMMF